MMEQCPMKLREQLSYETWAPWLDLKTSDQYKEAMGQEA